MIYLILGLTVGAIALFALVALACGSLEDRAQSRQATPRHARQGRWESVDTHRR
jgi:hypothetical protein